MCVCIYIYTLKTSPNISVPVYGNANNVIHVVKPTYYSQAFPADIVHGKINKIIGIY